MSADPRYHETRAAQEAAIVASSPEGEARQRHVELAERHADMACSLHGGSAAISPMSADDGTSTAIKLTRELIQKSYRILAESRSDSPGRADPVSDRSAS